VENFQQNLHDLWDSLSDVARAELIAATLYLRVSDQLARPKAKSPARSAPKGRVRLPRSWVILEPDLFDRRQIRYVGAPRRRWGDAKAWYQPQAI
jgi:hypothetical protein